MPIKIKRGRRFLGEAYVAVSLRIASDKAPPGNFIATSILARLFEVRLREASLYALVRGIGEFNCSCYDLVMNDDFVVNAVGMLETIVQEEVAFAAFRIEEVDEQWNLKSVFAESGGPWDEPHQRIQAAVITTGADGDVF